MRRRTIAITLALSALTPLAVAPAAPAKTTKAKSPKITRVTPMRLRVGSVVTIRGRNFSSKKSRNTVVFRASNGRSAFAKPRKARSRKLVVKVPTSIARILQGHKRLRFKLRVLVRRKFSRWTPSRLSPVILSGSSSGGGGGTATCGDDGDLLSKSTELAIGTDPCLKDTDGDGASDGFEERSAIDLNHYPATPPLPYPGKRPYPNALDPSDAGTDYDGDSLTVGEEYVLWTRFSSDGVPRSGSPTTLNPLTYSDGLQYSVVPAPSAPGGALDNWALDQNGDGKLRDDERDADGDGLANYDEARGQMTETWWTLEHDGTIEPQESKYPGINYLDRGEVPDIYAVADADGDGVKDGADDYDHDGLSNQFEVRRPGDWYTDTFGFNPAIPLSAFAGANRWAYTNPFNPCKPYNSSRCHTHPPLGYYDSDQVPPIGPNPPAGYPGAHPATPNN